jgi:hypothetical protein
MFDARVRFSFESEEEHLGPELAANVIANTIRQALSDAGFDQIEQGVTVTATPRGARVNAPTLAVEA